MKKLFIALCITMSMASVVKAGVMCTQVGNSTFCNGTDSNGGTVSSTTQQIGNSTYTNTNTSSGSQTCTTTYVGNTAYTNCY
ncbi:hypothetical protein [Citrobacter farmeri]|uniref:hypothetical protein n=1 Tax=Citrobacter farmeri TaxID=67824 RepID=UPI0018FF55D2|nr:hypothetical protein [Citrobacter farmeri]MBJ9134400.1 hypothetical protein [Citrobacter farmeri]